MEILGKIDSFVWGPPLLILLVGTGLYLTLRLGFMQIIRLPLALKYLFAKEDTGAQGGCDKFRSIMYSSCSNYRYR